MKNRLKINIGNVLVEISIFVAIFIALFYIFEKRNIQPQFFPSISSPLFISLVLINLFLVYHFLFEKRKIYAYTLTVSYIILLIVVLFIRPPYDDYQYIDLYYLDEWWKYLFENQIVFINIIGNVLLYVPLGMLLSYQMRSRYKYIIVLLIILLIECIQFLTKRGIFDWTDIILNYLGGISGHLVMSYKEK